MSNNILGMALRELRGLSNDLMEKLCGSDGDKWLAAFKRFLRKENPWESAVSIIKTVTWYRMVVDYNQTVYELVQGFGDKTKITDWDYPLTEKGKNEVWFRLFDFNKDMTSNDAVREMNMSGCRPATAKELLFFVDDNHEIFEKTKIVALVNDYITTMRVEDMETKKECAHVAIAERDTSGPCIRRGCRCEHWKKSHSFLAVRK